MATTETPVAVEKFVQLSAVKARYLEAGTGYPTILLHGVGYTNSAEQWVPAIQARFADGLHVFALDNIGWGMGDRPTFKYSLPFFVDYLREFQDALGFAKTNLVGHSLGGWIAGLFAYESPNRVNKLVLESIAGMDLAVPRGVANFQPPTEEQIRHQVERIEDPAKREEEFALRWRNASHPQAEAAYRAILDHLNDPLMRERYNLARRLPYIQVPTLVDWGANAPEGGSSLDWGHEVHSRVPGAKWNLIEGAGHPVPQDQPEQWAKDVREFLLS